MSLTVAELVKYLDHHKPCKKGKKGDKIRQITAHYLVKCGEAIPEAIVRMKLTAMMT